MAERLVGIRGATTVEANRREDILEATRELLEAMTRENALEPGSIVSALFTVTDDLNAEFPAAAARAIGWTEVALMCAREIPVPGSIGRCIRVLVHAYMASDAGNVHHVYLREARSLRPDLGRG
ncbi:MAG: chorismate mutase [Firmicutes bacterium]|nr:chorismate mutase [Bacillota bacterium]